MKLLLQYNLLIVLLDIYQKELKTSIHTKTGALMLRAALFVIAKTQKQTRCPSVGKQINKL